MVMAAAASGRSFLHCVGDNEKRWLVFGIGLNKVLVSQIRSFVEREIQKEYCNIKSSHGIDTQATPTRLTHWPAKKVFLKYENINGNDARPKVHGKFNYSAFDCRVLSHIDFAKLYVENFMAKFNAFDEHCDASAVLILLSKVPVFSATVQSAASDLRQSRNSWAHCAFKDWDTVKFRQSFDEMEKLVKALGLPVGDQAKLLSDLQDWESKGTSLCMNATVDPDLLQLVQHHVNELKSDVDKMSFDMESERKSIEKALKNFDELDARVSGLEQGFGHLQLEQKSLKSDVEDVKLFVERVQVQRNWGNYEDPVQPEASCANVVTAAGRSSTHSHREYEIADCESDIRFFAERHDPDTRNWLFDDFNKWFSDPGESRAYVLLGDAGVGKSVIAGALAQRMKEHLGAACFCRHYDDTRNDPRYLLGFLASQLCKCNSRYNNTVGGIDGVITMLHNNKLGVQELFTKLLEEPLAKCTHLAERKLVIIDALDETEYESREDFLFLIKERFPRLPHWLLFFITSRPEDKIRERLERYNPCVRICAGDSEQHGIYQQHEGDIRRFFENGVELSLLQFTVEEMTKSCNGLFLHAFYLRKKLNDLAKKGKMDYTLSDLLVDDVEDFFRDNFQRVFSRVGKDLYEKLIGCILAAPSPLPVSFIPFVLQQEKSSLDEQEVIDAVMQFAWNQTSNDTVTFLHKLIPTWLTKNPRRRDYQRKTKRKDCPHLLIDKKKAEEYLARIFEEILSGIVTEPSPAWPCINENLQDYAFRFVIRFLCQYGDQESVGIVFRCLTSFHFLEKRIESGKIGIYHLLEDLKLASCCPAFTDLRKKNILHEISNALESNVHILLDCPHLLISCLRSGSKVLQETGLIPKLSGPWLELSAFDGESINCLSGFNVFTTASDETISFLSRCLLDDYRKQMLDKFVLSPDGKLVAIHRGNKIEFLRVFDDKNVFTVYEQQSSFTAALTFSDDSKLLLFCVQDGVNDPHLHEWVVELGIFLSFKLPLKVECCCLSSDKARLILCGDNEVEIWEYKNSPCRLLANSGVSSPYSTSKFSQCTLSVENNLLACCIENIVVLFSVWDHAKTFSFRAILRGHLARIVFCKFLKVNRFLITYDINGLVFLWDLARMKAVTFAKITQDQGSIVCLLISPEEDTAVCLLSSSRVCVIKLCKLEDDRLPTEDTANSTATSLHTEREWISKSSISTPPTARDKDVSMLRWEEEDIFFNSEDEHNVEDDDDDDDDEVKLIPTWLTKNPQRRDYQRKTKRKDCPHLLIDKKKAEEYLARIFEEILSGIVTEPSPAWPCINENLQDYAFRFVIRFLCQYGDQESVGIVFRCLSSFHFLEKRIESGKIGIYHLLEDLKLASCCPAFTDLRKKNILHEISNALESNVHILLDCPHLLISCLRSGSKVLQETGLIPKLSGPWLELSAFDGESINCLSGFNVFTTASDETISFLSRCLLDDYRKQMLDKFVLSPDGKLVAIHRGNKIEFLRVFDDKNVFTVYEQQSSFTAALTFSDDSKLLLFCVQDGVNDPHLHEWVVELGIFLSFKLPLKVECCCLSSDKARLILCGDNEVEIWEYKNSPCRLLANSGVSSPYSTSKFSQCTLSVENNLLACCIENIVVLFSVWDHAKTFSFRAILRGHLARIVFCKFLKVNRFLITYDINGLVFLWDLARMKAVTFAKITQDQGSIVCLLISPEEDTAVCLLSSSRVCVIKLCKLEDDRLPTEDTANSTATSLHTEREWISKSSISTPPTARDKDVSMLRWEEEDIFFNSHWKTRKFTCYVNNM
ncbi:uncharacterized protein [Montipora foliosa]|uniref:uncharacterized protein n=1 Tax=Montipora foliosa TaxID=591990 RepID=UPI0035F11ABB